MKHICLFFTITLFLVFSASAQQDTTFQTPGFFVTHDPYLVDATAQQADDKILVSGSFSHYRGQPVTNLIRLLPTGERDSTFDPAIGTNGTISQILIQADGKIILSGVFSRYKTQAVSAGLIRILPNGTLDNNFIPYKPAPDYNGVLTACLQPDGKVILAGFGLVPGSTYDNFGIIRLNSSGTFDNTFTTQYILNPNEVINAIAVQNDGKILIGGSFSEWNGVPCTGLKRLNNDGTSDTSFHLSGQGLRPAINGNITTVQAIRLLGDTAILIGGNFGYYDNLSRSGAARLHADGSLDLSFAPEGAIIPYSIESIEPTNNGKVIVGGHFYVGNQAKNIVLLESDGSVDPNAQIPGPDNNQSFTPGIKKVFVNADGSFVVSGGFTGYYNGTYHGNIAKFFPDLRFDLNYKNDFQRKGLVVQTAIQPDGKIIVVGDFNQYGISGDKTEQNRIARLLPNGQLDTSFHAKGASHYTNSVAIQPGGDVLIAGSFFSVNNVSKKGIARLHLDGTLDQSFNTGSGPNDANIYAMHIDGQHIYVSGSFSTYDNTIHQGIVRLLSNGNVDQTFDTRGTPLFAPHSIETTAGGQVLVAEGSDKTTRDYNTSLRLYRLNLDGSIDNTFQTPKLGWSISKKVKRGERNSIYWLGELIQGATPGLFKKTIIRLKENGQLDSSAKRLPKNYYVSDFAVLPDSNLIISGQKINEYEDSTFFVLKLKPNLSIDSTFNPVSLYYNLKHINYMPDNRILVAGEPIRYFRLQAEQVQNVAILKNSSIQLVDASRNSNVINMVDTVVINETVTGNSANRSFTISNVSEEEVVLLDPSKVILSGANANEFSITMENNNTTINRQDSLRFTLKFSPSIAGEKKVRVTIPYSNGIDNKYSFIVTAKANITTPVENIEITNGVELYPNPVNSGVVYIKTKKKFQYYSIIDMGGRIAQEGFISPTVSEMFTIPVRGIHGGIYLLKLKSKGKEVSLKMIIH